jgi:hypothetical protein
LSNCSSFDFLPMWKSDFRMGGSCGNQISAWGVMQKSDFFSLVQWRFHDFFENVWKFVNGHRLY